MSTTPISSMNCIAGTWKSGGRPLRSSAAQNRSSASLQGPHEKTSRLIVCRNSAARIACMRRAPLNVHFSKRAKSRLAPVIQSSIEALCKRMDEAKSAGSDASGGGQGCGPQLMRMIKYQIDTEKRLQKLLEDEKEPPAANSDGDHATIFHSLLNGGLPAEEKRIPRLADEAMSLVAAGANTTAHTLRYVTFKVLSNVDILGTLKEELAEAIAEPGVMPTLQTLEQLPYLSAVIQEGIRLAQPVPHRLQRVSPNDSHAV